MKWKSQRPVANLDQAANLLGQKILTRRRDGYPRSIPASSLQRPFASPWRASTGADWKLRSGPSFV